MASRIPVRRRPGRRQEGNALLEFAIMSVVLLLLTCGVADFARLFSAADTAAGAAEAGVEYGALSPAHMDYTGMQNHALADTGNYSGATAKATDFWTCSIGGSQVSDPSTCSGSPQHYIQVLVTIPFKSVVNYPWVPNPISISQLACARVQ